MKKRPFFLNICMIVFILSVASMRISSVSAQRQTPINVASAVWMTTLSDMTTYIQIDAYPGDRNIPLRVTIQNLGNSTISGVTAYLLLDYPFRNTTGGNVCRSSFSGSISPGTNSQADFVMNIDLEAKPGEYTLPARFSYLEVASGVGKTLYFDKTVDANVPVVVRSTRVMTIYDVVLAPLSTVPGGNITVAGNILNTGKVSALNTNISVTSAILSRPGVIIVGQVDVNIPRPFSTRLQVRPGVSPGVYPVTVSATYSDSYGINRITRFEARLTIRQAEPTRPTLPERPSDPLSVLIRILRDVLAAFFGLSVISPVDMAIISET